MTWALTISRRAVPQRLGRSARALRRHVSRVGRVPAFEREGRRLLRAGPPAQPTARHRGRVWCVVDAHKLLPHILHHSSRTPCPRTYPARSSVPTPYSVAAFGGHDRPRPFLRRRRRPRPCPLAPSAAAQLPRPSSLTRQLAERRASGALLTFAERYPLQVYQLQERRRGVKRRWDHLLSYASRLPHADVRPLTAIEGHRWACRGVHNISIHTSISP